MKPITFESIRNLLKTKKKQKDKSSIDQSFKRSDSFKRISIRKSYLERGRKRNAAAVLRGSTKNLVNINEFEDQAKVVKKGASEKLRPSGEGCREADAQLASEDGPSTSSVGSGRTAELTIEEKLESSDATLDEKIRALQEINDRYINENRNLIEQTYEATRKTEKIKIKKPPRPSKQTVQSLAAPGAEDQSAEQPAQRKSLDQQEVQNNKDLRSVHPTSAARQSLLGSATTVVKSGSVLSGASRVKNISHVNINVSTEAILEEEDENASEACSTVGAVRPKHADDTGPGDDKSFYSISTFTIDNNTLTSNNNIKHGGTGDAAAGSSQLTAASNTATASSKRSFRSNFSTGTSKTITSSTSTATATNELPTLVTIRTYCEPNASMQSTTHVNERYLETSFDAVPQEQEVTGSRDRRASLEKKSTDRLKSPSRTARINTQTFKMIRSKSRDGIVIRIPAMDDGSKQTDPADHTGQQQKGSDDNLNRQLSNDSALDLIDVDIKVDEKDLLRRHGGSASNLTGTGASGAGGTVELKNQKNKYRKKAKATKAAAGRTGTLDVEDVNTSGGQNFTKGHDNFELQRTPNEPTTGGAGGTEPKFIFPNNYFEEENNIFYDQTLYDETELPSPENSIPYALRIKENPFTKNKEFYSINTGRIWKQLNLGQQEEDLSILSTPGPRLVPPPKIKNESFKSMSSRDSGFSLTLTKPKNLFRRKSKKAALLQRRKPPKLAVSRDGYFKRVMVVQRNSSKRKKSMRKTARVAGKDIFRELYDENWSKLGDTDFTGVADPAALVAMASLEVDAPDFARDFENFCNDRRYNQEIHDLEAFYEEHLKRLRHYYIQKKKMNEAAIKEFYRDYGAGRMGAPTAVTANDDPAEENDYYDTFLVSKNETIRFKNSALQQRYFQHGDAGLEFMFPYPDKRKSGGSTLGSTSGHGKQQKSSGGNNKSANGTLHSGTSAGGLAGHRKQLFHEVRPYGSALESLSGVGGPLLLTTDRDIDKAVNKSVSGLVTRYHEPPSAASAPSFMFKRSISAPFGDSNFQLTTPGDDLKRVRSASTVQQNEISLASIFPSVNGVDRSKSKGGSKQPHQQYASDEDDDDDDGGEFSENEFLINSLGDNLYCVRCDKMNSDCECFECGSSGDSPVRKTSKRKVYASKGTVRVGQESGEVKNKSGQQEDDEDDDEEEEEEEEEEGDENDENYCDVFDFNDINIIHVNHKKKVKRKKSKKRVVRKNHSTLRRGSYWGDITQKGYEKKRTRLLQPYLSKNVQHGSGAGGAGSGGGGGSNNPGYVNDIQSHLHHPASQQKQNIFASSGGGGGGGGSASSRDRNDRSSSGGGGHHHHSSSSSSHQHREQQQQQQLQQNRTRRSTQRKVTHNEKRYHSDSSTEDESIPEEGMLGRISTPDRDNYNLPRDHILTREPMRLPSSREHHHSQPQPLPVHAGTKQSSQHQAPAPPSHRPPQTIPTNQQQPSNAQHGATLSDTSSAGSPPAVHRNQHPYQSKPGYDMTDLSEFQPQQRPYAAPDITQFSANTRRGADRVTRYVNLANQEPGDTSTAGRWKVSAKIQQLLNTLKRPKRRPLPEFYEDNDIELEIAANPKDPNAPKPEGSIMTPVQGEQLIVPSGLPRTLEAALQRYGTSTFKAPMATVLDPNGKMTTTLTYGKLLSRAQKIAYALSTKVFSKGPEQVSLKPGDRVALVYPNSDPLNFLTAWYGCMFRGLVPLPIELPLSSSDSPPQQVGFLLSSCGVHVALTSEACLKGLPKSSTGEVAKLKGWPRLHWFVTEHLPKVPKDFNTSNNRISEDSSAYIEYTTDKDGSVMGVTVTRQAMINHCRALTMACHYTEGETIVCVLDFKREVGLWHSILTSVLNGMHVLFIPYALMKLRPSSWMQLITKYRASCCLVKSRDLHWGLLATKDHKEISLSSLRMLLVADGANPWSLSSCDQFLSVFQSKGLRPDAICPCASSSEVFTVSLRRPGRSAAGGYNQSATGRGVLSMSALSHGVVRVDSEDSLTSLTLQDCGQVMPSATMVVVNAEGPPVLCKTDQVGEICVTSGSSGTAYYGLEGMTNSTFKVQPLAEAPVTKDGETIPGKPINDEMYVRSGLLGFLGPGGLVFVCGSRDGLMTVTGRKHNSDDIIATVLAVEPMRFIYRGRIAVFSIRVLRDERVCVIAEQRPDCSEEESFQWMSRVLQAVDSIHQVGIYCLALVPPNHLPKTPLGGIHLTEARRRFLEGSLHPANVLMCPHTCVTNLPKPREIHHGSIQQLQISGTSASSSATNLGGLGGVAVTTGTGSLGGPVGVGGADASVGPASVMVGNLVQGNRLASAQGRDIGLADDNERKHQLITGVLRWRASSSPDHVLYTLLNAKGAVAKTLTCSELHKRAEKIAALLQERGKVNPGDHVALIFPPGLDLICAFYGCLYLGAVPVTIRPPHPQNLITTLPTVRMIVDVSKSGIILSIQSIIKLLKSREAATSIDPKSWPIILDIEDNPKRKLAAIANCTLDSTAYLDFSVSTCGRLSGVIITHRSLSSLCASLKLACELYPSRHVALCLDPYCGLGFSMWTLISVYSGHHSILIAPYEVEANPSLWLSTLSQYRVRDTFCSYGVIELCTKALSNSIQALKHRNINLGCVRTCVVVAEERPRVQLTQQFCKLFQALGLNTRCVSTSFGCRVNPAICVQGASSAESAQVYVDLRALRNNRVALVERGAPNSLCLVESGKLLPGVKVIIANPDTKGQCGDSHLGEIWVQSPHNSNGYFTIYGDETDYNDHFNAKLVTGCSTSDIWARTGYLGFLRRTECSQAGSILDETTPSIASRDSDTESIHSQGHNTLNSTTSSNAGGANTTTPATAGGEQELHDAVYVVGALDEVITLRGMNYHPIDIENSVLRCHKKIAECAVFTWTNLLVVVVELDGNESEALDLVPLVTNTVLEEHQLIVGVVVVVDPGVVPINSRGEKQRMHLRDGFLADQLDPIYVAYNM
ncbi:disco-interacting protein 2-like isoform X7 [Anopheles albimanus]|uniref:disco-interacting protein 2-like isoform X7 n=1 Tax=Anopheles albimanus TaxID=7167 RepID=UPI0016413FCC|nr:disco-interacting protein 2-like isoform X7 [Anopheles albimanus]